MTFVPAGGPACQTSRISSLRKQVRPRARTRYSRSENSLDVSSMRRPFRFTVRSIRSISIGPTRKVELAGFSRRRSRARQRAVSSLKLKGLGRQSSAPRFRHCTRDSTPFRPVSTKTEVAGHRPCMRTRISSPSISGKPRSRTSKSGGFSNKESSPVRPLFSISTLCFSKAKPFARNCPRATSSSRISTRILPSISSTVRVRRSASWCPCGL